MNETTTSTKDRNVAYAEVNKTDKSWLKKTAKKLGVSQSTVIRSAIKQARSNSKFSIN